MASIRIGTAPDAKVITFEDEIEYGKHLFLAMNNRVPSSEEWADVANIMSEWKRRLAEMLESCDKNELIRLVIDMLTDQVLDATRWES